MPPVPIRMQSPHSELQRPPSDGEKEMADCIAALGGQRCSADAVVFVAATGEPVGGDQAADARRMADDAGRVPVASPTGSHQVENDGEPGGRRAQLRWGGSMLLRGAIREHLSAFDHRRRCGARGAGIAHRAVEGRAVAGQPRGPHSGSSRTGHRRGHRSVFVAARTGRTEPQDLLVLGGSVCGGNLGTAGFGGYPASETVLVPHTTENRGGAPGHSRGIAASADHAALALVRYHVTDWVDVAERILGGRVWASHCVDGMAVRMAALVALLAPFGAPSALAFAAGLVFQTILIGGGLVSGLLAMVLGRGSLLSWRQPAPDRSHTSQDHLLLPRPVFCDLPSRPWKQEMVLRRNQK